MIKYMNRQPKLMSLSRMRDIFEPHLAQMREHFFLNNELGIVHGNPQVFRFVLQQDPPFTINDHRLGMIVRGEIHVNINLVEKHLQSGTLVFIGPGTIISPISFSDSLEIYGIGLSPEFPMPFTPGGMPVAFSGQVRDFQLQTEASDVKTAQHIIDTLWHVVHQTDYNRQTVTALVGALMHHYDGLYRQHTDRIQSMQSREQTLFDRFIRLVNQHAAHEHQMGFYANRLCISERYLGTIVKHASGTPAKEWIDRALITEAKVMLRHSDRQIVQVANELHFPNASFFCKYFKHHTGSSPQQYRRQS